MTFSVATLVNSGVLVTWMILSDSTEDLKVSVEENLVGFVTWLFGEDEAEVGVGVVFDLVDSANVVEDEGLVVLDFVVVDVGTGLVVLIVVVVDVVSDALVAAVVDNCICLVVVFVVVSAFGVAVVVVVVAVGLMDVVGELEAIISDSDFIIS